MAVGVTKEKVERVLTGEITSHYHDSRYLSKTNTSSFTPTSDYHPATKKYVDDLFPNLSYSAGDIVGENYTFKVNHFNCVNGTILVSYSIRYLEQEFVNSSIFRQGYNGVIGTNVCKVDDTIGTFEVSINNYSIRCNKLNENIYALQDSYTIISNLRTDVYIGDTKIGSLSVNNNFILTHYISNGPDSITFELKGGEIIPEYYDLTCSLDGSVFNAPGNFNISGESFKRGYYPTSIKCNRNESVRISPIYRNNPEGADISGNGISGSLFGSSGVVSISSSVFPTQVGERKTVSFNISQNSSDGKTISGSITLEKS